MIDAGAALARLRAGNERYVAGRSTRPVTDDARRRELLAGQEPFAVILGCADSRVPPEIVFDQGLGDLFVIRVVGNVAGLSQIGSIEFAVEQLGARLVVVLGHTSCGAVRATLEQLDRRAGDLTPGLAAVVDEIGPAVAPFLGEPGREQRAVRANIAAVVARLGERSATIRRRSDDGLAIVGAEYSLETGVVEFLDAV